MRIQTGRQEMSALAFLILFTVMAALHTASPRQLGGQDTRISLPHSGMPTITIVPSITSIVLSPGSPRSVERPKGYHPFQGYASFNLKVQSALPEWGAMLDCAVIDGPQGPVPVDRLWVKSESTGNEFVRLSGPVPVVTGDYRLPVKDEPVEVLFRPSWNDPAGIYRFRLLLNPFDPAATGSSRMSLGGPPEIHGMGGEIGGEYNNHQVIVISIDDTEIHFEIQPGPGIYQSDDDIVFRIWTNAAIWRVDCEATTLKSDRSEIPLDRILWERLDESGGTIDEGDMATNPTVLRGDGPVESLETTLRFKVNITTEDIAGSYNGTLSLVGSVED